MPLDTLKKVGIMGVDNGKRKEKSLFIATLSGDDALDEAERIIVLRATGFE